MRIDKLTIKGFKAIQKAKIELAPGVNLFLGHNGVGKTSILDAVIYALTDSIQGQAKKDFPEIINNHTKTAAILIDGIAGSPPFSFSIKRTLANTGRSGPSPEQIGAQLDVDPIMLAACLNAHYYFDLSPDYQKKFIIKALKLQPTLEDALDILEKEECAKDAQEKSWNKEIVEEIGESGWAGGYHIAYDLRRAAGQEVKILAGNRPKLINNVTRDNQQVPIEEIMEADKAKPLSQRLEAYKEEFKKFHEELGAIKALSKSDQERIEKDLEEYKAEKTSLADEPKIWTKTDTSEATKLRQAKADFEAKTKADIKTLETLAEGAESILAANKEKWVSDLKCPIPSQSGHKMCPVIQPDWSEQEKEIEEVWARVKALEETVFQEQGQLDAYMQKAEECKAFKARNSELDVRIQELEQRLTNVNPEIIEKKEKIKATIALLEKKIRFLEIAQRALDWNRETTKTLNTVQAKIEDAEAKRAHYDKLCKLLASDGIPSQLAAEKISVLNDRLRWHSDMIGQEILFTENLDLVQAGGKSLWTLGGSELARTRMAVAEAISHVTGIGLLLLDELNINVAKASTKVRNWLIEIGKTSQVIAVAATNAPGPPQVPENAPIRIFWVQDGKTGQFIRKEN
jgi:hypothetical protein